MMLTHDLPSRISHLDRAGLAALVERVFADDRPYDALAGLPLPCARRPLEAAAVRERVEAILDAMPDHWQASWHALLELLPLCELGDQHLELGEVDAARTVWLTIARTVQQRYPALRDEERELSGLIVDCARDLGRCLDASDAGLSRQLLIEDLAALWWWDAVEQDSVEVHPPIADVLTLHLDPDERHQLAAHLLARLGEVRATTPARRRRCVVDLIERLDGLPTSADERAWLLRTGGRHIDLAQLLLSLGQAAEALALLQEVDDHDLLPLAEHLERAGYPQDACRGVLLHPASRGKWAAPIRTWLEQRGVDAGTLEELVWRLRGFERNPTVGNLHEVREVAARLGIWSAVVPGMLAATPERLTRPRPVRARLLAELGLIDEAVALLGQLPEAVRPGVALAIAAAAERVRPDVAAALYREQVGLLRRRAARGALEQADALEQRAQRLAS